jgi:hypothetical protein
MAMNDQVEQARGETVRLRLGLGLFVFSWLPLAQLIIWLTGMHGSTAEEFRAGFYAAQWIIGILGLLLAGRAATAVVKGVGWRRAPGALWRMLRTGRLPDLASAAPKNG